MEREDYEKQYVGFEIKCKKCGNFNVYVDNSMGFSELSGTWGSIDLVCNDCNNTTALCES